MQISFTHTYLMPVLDHFKSLSSRILKYPDDQKEKNKNCKMEENGTFITDKFMSTGNVQLMTLIKSHSLITHHAIRNYMMNKLSNMLNKAPDDDPSFLDMNSDEVEKAIRFANITQSQIPKTLKDNGIVFDKSFIKEQLQKCIDINKDHKWSSIALSVPYLETITHWPMLKPHLFVRDSHEMEIIVIDDTEMKGDHFDFNQIKNKKYVLHLKDINKSITINHFPDEGYILFIVDDQLPLMFGQYNKEGMLNGYTCYYKNGELRQIYKYHNGKINGDVYIIENDQISVVMPFFDDQMHGLFRIVDSNGRVIYNEIFYKDLSLFVVP